MKSKLVWAATWIPLLLSSMVVVTAFVPPVPPAMGLAIDGIVLATLLLLATGVLDGSLVALLNHAHRATPAERAALAVVLDQLTSRNLLAPGTHILVDTNLEDIQTGSAGRAVIISGALLAGLREGWLSPEEAAALVGRDAALVAHRVVRYDAVMTVACLPVLILIGLFAGFYAALQCLFLGRLAIWGWRLRPVVFAVAIVQTHQGAPTPVLSYAYPALLAGLLATTYYLPWAERAWRRHKDRLADDYICQAGLAPALAYYLRRTPVTDQRDERLARIGHPVTPAAWSAY